MILPDNIDFPFFAYGIFKPGQLCFARIKDIVQEFAGATVNGILKERDGVPILVKSDNFKIKGYLIYFKEGREEEAYRRIMEIEPHKVYKWGEIKVNDNVVSNVLLGRKDKKGSTDLEYIDEWDGRSDPFFKYGLEEVETILKDNYESDCEYKSLFRLQMAYALLWSAIERYAGLRYHLGDKVYQKVSQIAEEKAFADSLKKNVKDKRIVYSATDLKKCLLDPNDPKKAIGYYYQARSNVVHRGKAVTRDFNTIKKSLEELLAIFRDVLDETFE